MTPRKVIINGKERQGFERHGYLYVREGFDCRVSEIEALERKARRLREDKSKIVERLIMAFNRATGWQENVKSAGDLYDPRLGEHIREAARSVSGEVALWGTN